jgi:NTP pyrophosphatase (non-canonical NTP hydrolase)
MKDVIFDDFQNSVDESLLRHKSILDVMTKLQDSQSRISRGVVKAVTNCGCIEIDAKKQKAPEDCEDIDNLNKCLKTHLEGKLCDNCREVIESEIGNNLFYLTSLCNILGISLYDVLIKEYAKMNTLGKYTFR